MTAAQGFIAGCCVGAVTVAVAFTLRDAASEPEPPPESPSARSVYAEMPVSAATWNDNDGPWPLTVDSAILVCEGEMTARYPFVRSPDGRLWPLNRAAQELAGVRGDEFDPAPLQRLGPSRGDPRVMVRLPLDGVERRAVALCDAEPR